MKPIIFSLCLALAAVVYSPAARANPMAPQSFQAVMDANPLGVDQFASRHSLELAPMSAVSTMPMEPLGEGHQTAMVIIAAGGLLLSAIALFSSMK